MIWRRSETKRRVGRAVGALGLVVAGATAAVGPAGAAGAAAAAPADVEPRSGVATFTDLTGGGACSFPGEPPDNLHVGLSTAEFGAAEVCGAYLDVTGPRGTVRVKVTDHCRRCPEGVVDITRRAFARIADVGAGRVPVTYRLARDPALVAPMSVRVKAGSSAWFLQLQVLDHGNPLRGVKLAPPGGAWRPLRRTGDNHWQASSPGPGEGPFTLRITDVHDQSATVYGIRLEPDLVQHTVARLYHPPAPGPAAPTPPTSPPGDPAPPAPGAPGPPAAPGATGASDGAGRPSPSTRFSLPSPALPSGLPAGDPLGPVGPAAAPVPVPLRDPDDRDDLPMLPVMAVAVALGTAARLRSRWARGRRPPGGPGVA